MKGLPGVKLLQLSCLSSLIPIMKLSPSVITVNIHESKTHLSRLVEQAAQGREFVIAKASKPMVRVIPLEAPPAVRTLGFLACRGVVQARLKDDFAADVDAMFSSAR